MQNKVTDPEKCIIDEHACHTKHIFLDSSY